MRILYPKIIDSSGCFLSEFKFIPSKVVCVGRNYSAHARELNNPIPDSPLLFIKSTNSLVLLATDGMSSELLLPVNHGKCHHELEIAILLGTELSSASDLQTRQAIAGIGLALDLTLRDLQSELKAKSHPWERAKSFDGACPISGFVAANQFNDLSNIDFAMIKNNKLAQKGNSASMMFDIVTLIKNISECFTLYPGDIILSGTPAGVAPLLSGDDIQLKLNDKIIAAATVL